jgi:hypothetical protein
MNTVGYSHGASMLVIDPHVQMAIWAIVAALACVLGMIIGGMVRSHNAAAAAQRNRPKKPDRRR